MGALSWRSVVAAAGRLRKEKTEPVDLVLVTDGSEVASDAVYQSAWNGLAQYGDESGLKYEASVPAGRTTEDYENTIKEAAQKEHPLSSVPERA